MVCLLHVDEFGSMKGPALVQIVAGNGYRSRIWRIVILFYLNDIDIDQERLFDLTPYSLS